MVINISMKTAPNCLWYTHDTLYKGDDNFLLAMLTSHHPGHTEFPFKMIEKR